MPLFQIPQSELASSNVQSVDSILKMNRADKLLAIEQCLDPKLLEQLSKRLKKGEFLAKVLENEFTPVDIRFEFAFKLFDSGYANALKSFATINFSKVSGKAQKNMADKIFGSLKRDLDKGGVVLSFFFKYSLLALSKNPKKPRFFLLRLFKQLGSMVYGSSEKIKVRGLTKTKTTKTRSFIATLKRYITKALQ